MCGIVGLAGVEDGALVRRMASAVDHRGPDGEGFFVGDGVSLGMRRLAVIDPAGSEQPIWSEDRRLLTICNGEIYNYRQLRSHLQARAHTFRTSGDVESIVHGHEEYGDAAVHLLRGMFAYAVWDRHRRRLLLVRDRLGVKPLYYARLGARLAFASEVKALLAVPEVSTTLDGDAVSSYLALQYVPGPRTMLEGIERLPPGHLLAWEDGRIEVRRYWDLVLDDRPRRLDPGAAAEAFRAQLEDAVVHHQVSDVPIGVLLSGGIDSAAVTALLARGGGRVKTFSVGFADGRGEDEGELPAARAVARHCGTEHAEVRIDTGLADVLPDIVRMQDEPVADPAGVAMFFVCRLAARSVKVVLTGEGGDELLGGYPRYGWLRLAECLRGRGPLGAAGRALVDAVPRGLAAGRLARRLRPLLGPGALEARHLDWTAVTSAEVQHDLTGNGRGPALALLGDLRRRAGTGEVVHDLMYVDAKTWLPDDVLTKTDRMSMAASIEARVPFLDHRLVEFAAGLPASLKGGTLTTKALLRGAMRDDLPATTRRRRKRAFLVPLRRWLGGELHDLLWDSLTASSARSRALVRPPAVARLLREQRSGQADHSRVLWTLLCLELWLLTVRDAAAAARG